MERNCWFFFKILLLLGPGQAYAALAPGCENPGRLQGLAPTMLHSSKGRRQEKMEGGSQAWKVSDLLLAKGCRASPESRGLTTRLPTSLSFRTAHSSLTCSCATQETETGSHAAAGEKGLERGFLLNGKIKITGGTLARPAVVCTQLPWQGMRACCSLLKTIALEMGWVGRKMSVGALSLPPSLSG